MLCILDHNSPGVFKTLPAMRLQIKVIPEVPYHLRAARLRWAAFAVTLDADEIEWTQAIMANTSASSHTKCMAQLLLCLHEREDLSKVCGDLHISRRRLLDLADRLTTKEGRRKLLSQPLAARGRPRRVIF